MQLRFPTNYNLYTDPAPTVCKSPTFSAGAVLPLFYSSLVVPYEQTATTRARVIIEKCWDWGPPSAAFGNRWPVPAGVSPRCLLQVYDRENGFVDYTGGEAATIWGANSSGLADRARADVFTIQRYYTLNQYQITSIDNDLQTLLLSPRPSSVLYGGVVLFSQTTTAGTVARISDELFDVTPAQHLATFNVSTAGATFPLQYQEIENVSLSIGATLSLHTELNVFSPYSFTMQI